MSMLVSLQGLARHAAQDIGRCGRQHSLEQLDEHCGQVQRGEEPISEFARFYCLVPDEPITPELLEKVGFLKEDYGHGFYYNVREGGFELTYNPSINTWFYCGIVIAKPNNLPELWCLTQALGFKLKPLE